MRNRGRLKALSPPHRRATRRKLQSAAGLGLILATGGIAALPDAHAADVEITSTTSGVNLDSFAGTTAHIASGVTVTNTGTLMGGSFPGIYNSIHTWTLTNDGTITSNSDYGIRFAAGGAVNNKGTIDTLLQAIRFEAVGSVINSGTINAHSIGVWLRAGGSVDNLVGGTVTSTTNAISINSGVGTVTNAGTLSGTDSGVALSAGGTVTNFAGGLITGTSATSGAVSITGVGTITNDGTIRNTGTNFAAGILVQGGAATVTNGAGGQIFGTYNGVYASSSAPLTLNNQGLISSTNGPGVEASAGTYTNSGTIQSANDGMKISGAATVTNSGTIGSTGAGRAIVFSGSASHTLNLSTGSVLNGNVQGGSGTDNLVLQGTGTESIAKFLAFETLSMQGIDWTLNDARAFTTSAQVQSGILRVDGQLTSPTFSVAAAGTLTGTGTVVSNVTSTGTVRVDTGALTINGNFVNNGGAFNVGVTPATSGKLDVTGAGHTATLNGGTVQVNASTGTYALSTVYTILSATGGVTGMFAGATSNFAFLAPTVSYDLNNVYLTLDRNAIDFTGIGGTPNERAAGRGVEGLGNGNTIYNSILLLTAPQALGAFDQLSGEIHATAQRTIIDDQHFVRDAILDRLRSAGSATPDSGEDAALGYARKNSPAQQAAAIFPASPGAPVYTTWGQAYGTRGRADGDGNAAALSADRAGLVTGLEVAFDRERRIGVVFGASETRLDVADRMSNATIDSYHAAFYGGTRWGAFGLRGGAALTWNDLRTQRTIAFPGFAETTTANYSGVTGQIFGEAGYRFNAGGLTAEPFGGLAHIALRTDPFSETGGAAAVSGLGGSQQATFSTLGLRLAREMLAAPLPLAAHVSAGWRHIVFGDATPTTLLAFTGAAPSFVVAGVPLARDTAVLDAGLDAALSRAATIGLAYNGQFSSGATEHTIKGLWRYRF